MQMEKEGVYEWYENSFGFSCESFFFFFASVTQKKDVFSPDSCKLLAKSVCKSNLLKKIKGAISAVIVSEYE